MRTGPPEGRAAPCRRQKGRSVGRPPVAGACAVTATPPGPSFRATGSVIGVTSEPWERAGRSGEAINIMRPAAVKRCSKSAARSTLPTRPANGQALISASRTTQPPWSSDRFPSTFTSTPSASGVAAGYNAARRLVVPLIPVRRPAVDDALRAAAEWATGATDVDVVGACNMTGGRREIREPSTDRPYARVTR